MKHPSTPVFRAPPKSQELGNMLAAVGGNTSAGRRKIVGGQGLFEAGTDLAGGLVGEPAEHFSVSI